MIKENKVGFCVECRKENEYEIRKVRSKRCIKDKEYEFLITTAICKGCGEEINIPGLLDKNAKEIDDQYRRAENIISIDEIQKLMDIYNLGKAPLSMALGFGEITITRYLLGQIPSKEYSEIMRKALVSPDFMKKLLGENNSKIGDVAYRKAMKVIEELEGLFVVSEKMLITISYIFDQVQEITPLALQKILYFIQGIYMVICGSPLYEEDCQAWVHGPVYEAVYDMFRSFKYNPIDDNRFLVFKNRYQELNDKEKEVIDLVIRSFGMYSGKTLEQITHKETPWLEARKNCEQGESSVEVISKISIKNYFENISNKYNLRTVEGINNYIIDSLKTA